MAAVRCVPSCARLLRDGRRGADLLFARVAPQTKLHAHHAIAQMLHIAAAKTQRSAPIITPLIRVAVMLCKGRLGKAHRHSSNPHTSSAGTLAQTS